MPSLMKLLRGICFYILHFAICYLLCGCYNPFSPSVTAPGFLKPIARQVDPDSVLYNFKYAYENRDSLVYENCLDEEFVFTFWDQDKMENPETEFFRMQDLKATKDLFRTFDEIKLEWRVEPDSDRIVGEEIWKVRKVVFDLSIWDTNGDFNYQSIQASGTAEFFFRRSRKDNLWRIVHWIDKSISP